MTTGLLFPKPDPLPGAEVMKHRLLVTFGVLETIVCSLYRSMGQSPGSHL